jgi:DNA polymerase-1
MEWTGVRVDSEALHNYSQLLSQKLASIEAEIREISGESDININSSKQLGEMLFGKMRITAKPKMTKTKQYCTDEEYLQSFAGEHRVVDLILEYRGVKKLLSTYVDALPQLINAVTGHIHTSYNQAVTATGRLSSTNPNLQNIPVRDDYGRLIRKAFVTESEGNSFTGSDYSQIELRILASLSGDESLISDFRQGKDIHKATAARVFDIPEDEVTPLDRTKAKAVNFGVVYGMSGFGLGESLNISRTEGQRYINEYFAKHKAVKDYLDRQIEEGEKNREVRTYFGRVRQIPEFASRKFMEREFAKRLAMNTPIQGTAADVIKIAMNSVSAELERRGLKSRLILQIHDELIVEGPDSETEEVKQVLDECMRGAADLAVELTVDIHSGKTWYELK